MIKESLLIKLGDGAFTPEALSEREEMLVSTIIQVKQDLEEASVLGAKALKTAAAKAVRDLGMALYLMECEQIAEAIEKKEASR
jgi:hypothetical protein